ncbi:PAS domain-containing hybrid sensor histidine kinase/response regulator [Geminicoccus roseus]|uniref:PAS domain-containing hybrid sensor histidine kinase/response regulator n=1 Tax=Geminicoccus roseus TaxID=404900 RepID=UPI00040C8567|nr:PAS domain-containing hybrid sensor histidine kinase/response regulator [Geminicoccus roseus]
MPDCTLDATSRRDPTPRWAIGRVLETRLLPFIGGLFFLGVVTISGALYLHLHNEDVEQRALEQRSVEVTLDGLSKRMRAVATDYATLQELIEHGPPHVDLAWMRANLGGRLEGIYGYGAALLDRTGGVAYAHRGGVEGPAAVLVSAGDLARLQAGLDQQDDGQPLVTFLRAGSRFFLTGAARVGVDNRPGPTPLLLFSQEIGEDLLASLSSTIELDAPLLAVSLEGRSSLASAELTGLDGQAVGYLAWSPHRPGSETMTWLVPPVAGGLVLMLVFVLLALRWRHEAQSRRNGERRFRDFTQTASDWAWETDEACRFTWVSDRFLAVTGLRMEQVLGRGIDHWRIQDPAESGLDHHRQAVADRRPFREVVFALATARQERLLIAFNGLPHFDKDSRFRGYRGTARDVTAAWSSQRQLQESEQRFRSLVENLQGIVFTRESFRTGETGDEVVVYGADAEALARLILRHGGSDMAAWYRAMHPDDREAYARLDARLRRDGIPFVIEFRLLDLDGGEGRWMRGVHWLVDDGAGNRFLDSFLIDVTEQKKAEAALEAKSRENELYRAIVEILPDHVYAKDAQLRFVVANQATAASFGIADPALLIGRSDSDLHPPELADRYREDELAILAEGSPGMVEQPIYYPNGSEGWVMALKVPLRDRQGRIAGLVGHTRDITGTKRHAMELAEAHARLEKQAGEMRELAVAAERASRAKTEFLAAMSHEIRTPMTGVIGMAELLAAEGLSGQQLHYVETIRRSGGHLLSIINDILDFSRIEAGRLELEQVDFAPSELVEQACALLSPQATERGLDLRVESGLPQGLVVQGDPKRLLQVMVNLIGNALKFTPRGAVVVRVAERPCSDRAHRLRLEVQDTGVGIPAERQGELFRPFVQADRSTSRHFGGSGLGLAICRRLIDAMGGSIGLESEVGRGSVFWVEVDLPAGDSAAMVAQTAEPALPPLPLRVLVVDDVVANRELLSIMLTRQGHEVILCENGADAVARVAADRFDVVLMDVQMPVMDGMEATRRIRQFPAPAGATPIVALTANVMASERARYLGAGMNHCLTKPVVWPDLFATLAAIASGGAEGLASAPAAPAPPPSGLEAALARPLLDRTLIDGMAARMPPAMLAKMLARGLDGATESCARLHAALGDPVVLAQEAHRLRGTAGTFGLARISALAGAVEDRLRSHENPACLLGLLDDALAATGAAVRAQAAAA